MQCKACKYPDSHVLYTLHDDAKNLITRRRECLRCNARWTTQEKLKEYKRDKEKRA